MKIYHYSKRTKEYLRETNAKPDPLEKGKWLIPAFATDKEVIKPKNGYVSCFIDNNWVEVQDNRGKTAYNVNNGQPILITELGELTNEYTLDIPIGLFNPKYIDGKWEESAILYKGKPVKNKQDVYNLNQQELLNWNNFVLLVKTIGDLSSGATVSEDFLHLLQSVATLKQEGEDFITSKDLKDK